MLYVMGKERWLGVAVNSRQKDKRIIKWEGEREMNMKEKNVWNLIFFFFLVTRMVLK